MRHGYDGKDLGDYVAACGPHTARPYLDVPVSASEREIETAIRVIGSMREITESEVDVRVGYNPSFVDPLPADEYVLRYEAIASWVRADVPKSRLVFGDTIEGMPFERLLERSPERELVDVLDLGYYDHTTRAAKAKLIDALGWAADQDLPVTFNTVVFKGGATARKIRDLAVIVDLSEAKIESVTLCDRDFTRDPHLTLWGDCRVTRRPETLNAWAEFRRERESCP